VIEFVVRWANGQEQRVCLEAGSLADAEATVRRWLGDRGVIVQCNGVVPVPDNRPAQRQRPRG
jgi:hypothetical protein